MEGFLVLLALGVVGGGLFVCYAAVSSYFKLKGLHASDLDSVRRIGSLEDEVAELRRRMASSPGKTETASPPPPAAARERVTPAPVPPPPPIVTPESKPIDESLSEPLSAPEIPGETPAPAMATSANADESTHKTSNDIPSPVASLPGPDSSEAHATPAKPFDWEIFTGKYLFAWVGGFALFLGAAFFVKYSFDHNLITPLMRVFFGALTGVGLIIASVYISNPKLKVTIRTLAAAGIAILYSDVYAARAYYAFLSPLQGFLLMTLVTITGFFLSVRLEGKYVAVLSAVGGFLTPVLMSTGQNNPVGLFTYVAFIDAGLLMTAKAAGWSFPVALAAAGTAFLQLGWYDKFFDPADGWTPAVALGVFSCLFAFIAYKMEDWKLDTGAVRVSCAAYLIFAALFPFDMLSGKVLGEAPLPGFALMAVFSVASGLLLTRGEKWRVTHGIIGSLIFAVLLKWTGQYLSAATLYHALGAYVLFAVLFPAMSIMSARRVQQTRPFLFGNLYPLLMIITVLVGIIKSEAAFFVVWPVLFLLALAVAAVTVISGVVWLFAAAIGLMGAAFIIWLGLAPAAYSLSGLTLLVLLFAAASFAFGVWAVKRLRKEDGTAFNVTDLNSFASLPVLSAITPFVFVLAAIAKMRPANPSLLFGVCAIISAMLLYISRTYRVQELPFAAAMAWGLCHFVWQKQQVFSSAGSVCGLSIAGFTAWWISTYFFFFLLYAALFRRWLKEHSGPWGGAFVSGVVAFLCLHPLWKETFGTGFIGLLPAAIAVAFLLLLLLTLELGSVTEEPQKTRLALSGAGVLIFVTLIFPLQFDRQWLTIGWALEGLSLVWLYRRVPHEGLRFASVLLLLAAFARLGMNPQVFDYSPRSATPVFNWYLYAYGLTAAALFTAWRIWTPGDKESLSDKLSGFFPAAGTLLLFLLMNIEIADFFSTGTAISFFSHGNFARDLSYTVGWGLFASVLLAIGIMWKKRLPRQASIGLFCVTLLKLFFMDLWQLSLIYRAAAFVALAVMLMAASFVYQKFLAGEDKADA